MRIRGPLAGVLAVVLLCSKLTCEQALRGTGAGVEVTSSIGVEVAVTVNKVTGVEVTFTGVEVTFTSSGGRSNFYPQPQSLGEPVRRLISNTTTQQPAHQPVGL